MKKWKLYYFVFFGALLFNSCQGTVIPTDPVKEMKKDFSDKYAYTVLLNDMDLEGKTQYKHKYKIITFDKEGNYSFDTTDWVDVSDNFFYYHENDLGMEILTRSPNQKYNELPTPPGFSQIIGNKRYGKWDLNKPIVSTPILFAEDSTTLNLDSLVVLEEVQPISNEPVDTNHYWFFSEEEKRLEQALELQGMLISLTEFNTYKKSYLYNRPYYGSTTHKDSTRYGTSSRHWFFIRPFFYQRRTLHRNFKKPFSSSGNRGGGGFGK